MDEDVRTRADSRLASGLRAHELADPRDEYRARLRALRDAHADLFARALRHYEDVVLPALAGNVDPVTAWIDYGRFLAELVAPGTTVVIDAMGRATPYTALGAPVGLVLHLPGEAGAGAWALVAPLDPTPAQRATYDLLVRGRLGL